MYTVDNNYNEVITTFDSVVSPTDAKIFYEDNKPYLEYTGIVTGVNGEEVKIHFPKISLEFQEAEINFNRDKMTTTFSSQTLIQNPEDQMVLQVITRNMTKKEIEKELGYKINIID